MLHPNPFRCYCQSLLLAVCLFISFGRAGAQSCYLFTIADGLPSTMINDIIEDSDHYIWIATEYGLCKYDGSKIRTYQYEEGNPHSLQQNYVRCLFVDNGNHLLVGTRTGLQVYRPQTDDFSHVALFEGSGRESGDVSKIIQRQNGEIWLAGNTPCCARLEADGTPVLYSNPFTDQVNFSETLVEDNAGRIWTNHRMKSMHRLEISGEITNVLQDDMDVPFNVLAIGADGQLYAGGQRTGLYRFNQRSQRFDLISAPNHSSFIVADIRNLDEQHLLVATDNQGLMLYDYRSGSLEPSVFDDGRIDPLTQKVHSVWIDHNHDMWLALYQKGLLIVRQHPQPFRYFGQSSLRYNIVGDKCITSISASAEGWVWVSTDNGGLYAVNSQGQQLRNFPYTGQPGTIPASLCRVFEDSRHRLWYGAYAQGYGWVDPNTGRCTALPIRDEIAASSSFFDFAEDHLGRIWAATMGLGVYRFDEEKRSMNYHVQSELCRWSHCIYFEPLRRKLYVGSYNGLTEIDAIDENIPPRQFLDQYIVYSIVPYTSGRLALCTSEGLVIFDLNTCQHVSYTIADGLLSNMVYAGGCDGNGLLWVTTNLGLTCFNEKQGTFTNFNIHDGLQSNEFYKNVSLIDHNGDLWFGGTNGLTFFNPREVSMGVPECDVRIVSMTAGESKVSDMSQLSFDDNSLTFEMASLPVWLTHQVIFSYSMDGDPWVSLPAGQNQVSFSRLSPGNHTFSYRAQIGHATSAEHSVTFHVNFPWYQSWWMQLLILALVAVIFIMGYSQFTHRSRVRKRLAQHLQNEALDKAKIKFFVDVADEIRTPMTLIMSPLQTLLDTDSDSSRQLQYRMIQRNSNRIVELINKLMDQHHIDSKIILPEQLEAQPEAPAIEAAADVLPVSHSHKLIIVADADPEIRHFMAQELSAEYRVLECPTGREAFDQIMRLVPDLIISDVKIPEVSGMELCRRVRQNVRINHIPIIMLSAVSTEETRIESLDLGADAFLTKPFNMKVLRRTVRNLLQSRDRLRNSFSGQQMPTDLVETPESKSPDERLMERIIKVVNQNLSNPDLTSEMIASEVGMSRVHLYRKLKELTNQSARNFIRNIRLAKAAELLSQKKVSVAEVADKVGFTNSSNFATAFKELYGVTPTAYMDEHLHKDRGDASEQ